MQHRIGVYRLSAAAVSLGLLLAGAHSLVAAAAGFNLEVTGVKPNATLSDAQVYNGFGCKGQNTSPAMQWSGAPSGTRSFAVTVYDPDAPTGSGWWHWLVYDIPPSVSGLPAHAGDADGHLLPPGAVQGRTDFGTAGFGGACPPAGSKPHRYVFTLYALKVDKIDVPPDSSAAMVGFMLKANQLANSSVTALYGR